VFIEIHTPMAPRKAELQLDFLLTVPEGSSKEDLRLESGEGVDR
jgi:hypothetical protein